MNSDKEASGTRLRMVWTVLIAGLVAVALAAVISFLRPGDPDLDRFGPAPPFNLTSQTGQVFSSNALEGKVWIADFIFTRCGGLCPALAVRMRELQEELDSKDDWMLVSFSVDPEYDTPEVLAEYASNLDADPERWKFLTGERDTIRAISIQGFKLAVDENPENTTEPIVHSQRMILVDAHNQIRGYYDGLDSESMKQLIADSRRLIRAAR
jgi:protein SCO1/2